MDKLRVELKEWENQFKSEHGRAPTRQDIKNDAVIAAKYKQYNASKVSSAATATIKTPVKKKQPKKVLAKPADKVVPSLAHASPPKAKLVLANSPRKLKKLVEDASPRKPRNNAAIVDPFTASTSMSVSSPPSRNPFAASPKKDSPNTKFMKALLEQAEREERQSKKERQGGPSWEEILKSDAIPSFTGTGKGKGKGKQDDQVEQTLKDLDMDDIFGPSPVKPDAPSFTPLLDDSPVKATVPSVVPAKRAAGDSHDQTNNKKGRPSAFNARKVVNAPVGETKVTAVHVPPPRHLDFNDDDDDDENDDDDDEKMTGSPRKERVLIRHRLEPLREESPPPPDSLLYAHVRSRDEPVVEGDGEGEHEKLPDAMDELLSLSPTKARLRVEAAKKEELVKKLLKEPSVSRKRAGLADLDDDEKADSDDQVPLEGDDDWESESDGWNRIEGDLDDW